MLALVKSQKKEEPPPGRDLDRRIARALGIEVSESLPPYSTDEDVAVALAESFAKKWGYWEHVKLEVDGGWTVGWIEEKQPLHHSIRPIQSSAPTRALAICRSILKVVESVKRRSTQK
jgi:hypothetical protein